jgi:hypothetical protein
MRAKRTIVSGSVGVSTETRNYPIFSSLPGPKLLRRIRATHFVSGKLDRPNKSGDDGKWWETDSKTITPPKKRPQQISRRGLQFQETTAC